MAPRRRTTASARATTGAKGKARAAAAPAAGGASTSRGEGSAADDRPVRVYADGELFVGFLRVWLRRDTGATRRANRRSHYRFFSAHFPSPQASLTSSTLATPARWSKPRSCECCAGEKSEQKRKQAPTKPAPFYV